VIVCGQLQLADEKIIIAWKLLYRLLESVDVVILFAPDINRYRPLCSEN